MKNYVYVMEVSEGERSGWKWTLIDVYQTKEKAEQYVREYKFISHTDEDMYHNECDYYEAVTCNVRIRKMKLK